ncbi:MAG TPA: hypothetical protein DD827_08225 [Gammaproteobacteria bacterium]|jgi:hypothetical protein|nr:hypothetical protein [Gammaproteobacteria bacterium]
MKTQNNLKTFKAALITSVVSLASPFALQAAELELALSNETAAAELIVDSSSIASGGADLRLGLLFTEDDDYLTSAGLLVRGAAVGERPIAFGLGAVLYYGNVDGVDANVGALALGFGLKYVIPGNTPIGLGGEFFFAPDITSFGDTDQLLDFRLRAEIDVLPSATAFIGYRGINAELSGGGDYDIDENIHLGIRFQF